MSYKDATFEDIEKIVNEELNINPDDLDLEAIRNQKIFGKFSKMYVEKSRQLNDLLNSQSKVEFNRYRHYAGKMDAEHYKKEPITVAILKTDIPSYMAIDEVVVEMRNLVKECERIVKYLEESKKSLYGRGFDIKNAIDYRRLMMGQ